MRIYVYSNIQVMSKAFTSVKVDKDVYEQFKQICINRKFHLQDLVNRSLYLFMNDSTFRDTVYNYNVPVLSKESQETVLPSLQQTQQ
jgi:hypothetical protein